MPRYMTVKDLPPMPREMEVGKVSYRINRYYCRPLALLGKCKDDCVQCQGEIQEIFNRITKTQSVRDPYGLFVYLLRDRVAEIMEESEISEPRPTNWLGESISRNPFTELRKQFEKP